jgi:hypothetical protein
MKDEAESRIPDSKIGEQGRNMKNTKKRKRKGQKRKGKGKEKE